jgi:hypothetical protein
MKSERRLREIIRAGKPLIEERLGAPSAALFENRVLERYGALNAGAPSFKRAVNNRLFSLGVPLLAAHRVLLDDFHMEKAAAVSLLEAMVVATMRPRVESLAGRALLNVTFRLPIVRDLGLRQAYAADEPDGFRFEEVRDPEAAFGFDVHECALVKYCRAQGAPEIVPILCRLDDLMAAQLRGLRLVRKGTIATGAERCDFRYVKTKG